MQQATVGVFDSGVGGLSVWREIADLLPGANLVYLADQQHCPYGARSVDEIRAFGAGIVRFMIDRGADVIVVACNTASAAALHTLRQQFEVPIVGMEPAIKPAVARTKSGHVGVIATQVTFQGELFASLLERFADGAVVHTQICPGLVERVEAGCLEDAETLDLLQEFLAPLLEVGIDTLVLGCTHYPFLRPAIARVVGEGVEIIDPAPAVARQVRRVLVDIRGDVWSDQQGRLTFYTTAACTPFARMLERLVGPGKEIRSARWCAGGLVEGRSARTGS
jgi:glutamate racemase